MMPGVTYEDWNRCKKALLPYDGMASQIYVLDIPISQLIHVLGRYETHVKDVMVTSMENFGSDKNVPLNDDIKSKIKIMETPATHTFKGLDGRKRYVGLWLWVNHEKGFFDAELVFYGDEFFPNPDDDGACQSSFGSMLSLANQFKEDSVSSRIVLSPHETGHPEENRAEDVWL